MTSYNENQRLVAEDVATRLRPLMLQLEAARSTLVDLLAHPLPARSMDLFPASNLSENDILYGLTEVVTQLAKVKRAYDFAAERASRT